NTALDDVSFTVEPGTVFALLGENGAGKTTTIKTLLGLCRPDSGTSTVLGLDCLKDDLKIRQSVGYVPEQPILYDWMSVQEIGRFSAAFYPPDYLKRYGELLQEYELPPTGAIKSLSKGQRAKVSLALALAHDPELLILDEPTSGLDALVRREFLESMLDRAATGKTVFLSSHQIGEVERVADTVAVMKKSKLLLVEPLETLKQRTKLLTLTLNEPGWTILELFDSIIEQRVSGRDISILGSTLRSGAEETLKSDTNVSRFEIRTPSLEEIFIGLMNEGDF
ncbi:MAG: ABC transporter ATP-binding protein, partial [Planctomycetaceae bacterium]|nr:ABC transporter ATP-binding protein [Planctomycetaceae bacterium]